MWATTWTRILDHCADVNGAPLTRTPPRQSWGRGPSPLGVAANSGPSVDVSFTASCAAPTGRVPGLGGAFIIASTLCSCVGIGDQQAVLLDCSKSSRQCSLPSSSLLTYGLQTQRTNPGNLSSLAGTTDGSLAHAKYEVGIREQSPDSRSSLAIPMYVRPRGCIGVR